MTLLDINITIEAGVCKTRIPTTLQLDAAGEISGADIRLPDGRTTSWGIIFDKLLTPEDRSHIAIWPRLKITVCGKSTEWPARNHLFETGEWTVLIQSNGHTVDLSKTMLLEMISPEMRRAAEDFGPILGRPAPRAA